MKIPVITKLTFAVILGNSYCCNVIVSFSKINYFGPQD